MSRTFEFPPTFKDAVSLSSVISNNVVTETYKQDLISNPFWILLKEGPQNINEILGVIREYMPELGENDLTSFKLLMQKPFSEISMNMDLHDLFGVLEYRGRKTKEEPVDFTFLVPWC